jgi:NADH dehydrogenase
VNDITRRVQLSSRSPHRLHARLEKEVPNHALFPPIALDVTKPNTLVSAFEGAKVIVSLVGLMHGTPQQFDEIQWRGAENVAYAAKGVGAKLIHFSAIGADPGSHIPYERTKGLAEMSVLEICPNATIIRPSLVFGPGDDFFNVSHRVAAQQFLALIHWIEVCEDCQIFAFLTGIWWGYFTISTGVRRRPGSRSRNHFQVGYNDREPGLWKDNRSGRPR